jgi:hypothetical protein
VGELNHRAQRWLDARVHRVPSRSTGERPADRLVLERPFLSSLPRARFDTDYVESRRVHNIVPFIALDGVRYSVPPEALGQLVEVRRPVDSSTFTVRWAGRTVATHRLAERGVGTEIVWDPAHRAATEAIARTDGRARPERHLHLVEPLPTETDRLMLGEGDYDVDEPDLAGRYGLGGELA